MSILPKSLGVPQSSIILNLLWLLFATSFIWFPYIGMISMPCRKGSSTSEYSLRWSPNAKFDYNRISKLIEEKLMYDYYWKVLTTGFLTTVPLSVSNHSFTEVMKV